MATTMTRTLEPEVMDDPERTRAYADADFSAVNQGFVEAFLKAFPVKGKGSLIDLGCGPADILSRLAKSAPGLRITGVDASGEMLRHGRQALKSAGLLGQVELVEARIPDPRLPGAGFDAVISNSLLHHLPDPAVFWREVRRLAKPGAAVYVMDLLRPESKERARDIVETQAAGEHPFLKEDFFNSLLAAFTLEEVRAQLAAAGLSGLKLAQASDRHWLASGRL